MAPLSTSKNIYVNTIVFVVLLTYIFWGSFLGIMLAIRIGRNIPYESEPIERIWSAVRGSALITALFTPASMGAEGFGWIIPLPLLLFFSEHTHFLPKMIPATFVVAF